MDADLVEYSVVRKGLVEIPKHQRSYEWDETNWRRIWITVLDAYLDAETSPGAPAMPDVFMGAVVKQELERLSAREMSIVAAGSEDLTRTAVVDGQQRMVTLSILCAAIRDFYYRPDAPAFVTITNRFICFPANVAGDEIGSHRLIVQSSDADAYDAVMAPKHGVDDLLSLSRRPQRIAQAYLFFMKALAVPVERQVAFLSDDLELSDPVAASSSDEEDEFEEAPQAGDQRAIDGAQASVNLLPNALVRDWDAEQTLVPESLLGLIENRLKFAVITLSQSDENMAFEIFETLNTAGVPLSNVDKFRNGYFMLAPDDADHVYEKYWVPMERIHGSGGGRTADLLTLEDFFFNEGVRKFGWTPADRTYQRLIGYVKARVQSAGTTTRSSSAKRAKLRILGDELGQILVSDRSYRRLHEWLTNDEPASPPLLAKQLRFFRAFDAKPMTPVLMEILRWSEPTFGDAEAERRLLEALRVLEGFLIRRLLGGVSAQQLRSSVADLPKQLREQLIGTPPMEGVEDLAEVLRECLQELGSERYPDDDALRAAYEVPVYQVAGKKRQLFLTLWGLECELSPDHATVEPPPYGTGGNNWSVEHVLPQGVPQPRVSTRGSNRMRPELAPGWQEYWERLGVADTGTEFRQLRHCLGNLTLLRGMDNSLLGTDSFVDKKAFYADRSDLRLTKSIVEEPDWTPVEIRQRSRELIDLAIRRWSW